jgi:tRNA(adenine34) deaminase
MRRVVFGCPDLRAGAAGGVVNLVQFPSFNHRCEITAGVLQEECAGLLQTFFKARRRENVSDA